MHNKHDKIVKFITIEDIRCIKYVIASIVPNVQINKYNKIKILCLNLLIIINDHYTSEFVIDT